MQQKCIGLLVLALTVGGTTQALAQTRPWNDRVFANISFGMQAGSQDLRRTDSFELYAETATIESASTIGSGPNFDVVVGGRLKGSLGAAVGIALRSKDRGATINGSIPDPIFFDQPRGVTMSLSGLTHSETWITPSIVWFYPVGARVDTLVTAGPAFVRVEHQQVGAATVTEQGSGPALDVTTSTVNKTATGFSVGGDLRYLLTANFGVGGFVRYARASVDLDGGQSLDVGGVQLGVGVRIRY